MKKILVILTVLILMLSIFSGNAASAIAIADAKISDDLDVALATLDSAGVTTCVTLTEVAHNTIMEEFNQRYPLEYEAYTVAKLSTIIGTPEDIPEDILQNAIEHKREICRQHYASSNASIIGKYIDDHDIVFISSYAPFAIVELNENSAFRLAQDTHVLTLTTFSDSSTEPQKTIDYYSDTNFNFNDIMKGINLSNQISRADYVRDTHGNSGSGVKIGMVEAKGIPDVSHPQLSGATIVIRDGDSVISDHATVVAAIMVGKTSNGTNIGASPDATLYSCITPTTSTLYEGIEWLIDSGVNVINCSLASTLFGEYNGISAWIDHIAVTHDVHIVIAAGNSGGYLNMLGLAYNAITVGAYNANSSTYLSDFNIAPFSSYIESNSHRPEKPNIVANGVLIQPIEGDTKYPNGFAGTSFTAPQAAGVVAQLCSYSSALKVKQSAVGAILAASAALKVDSVGTGEKGDSFTVATRVEGNTQISNVEGAGILDARWARWIVASGNYWSPVVYASNFPYSKSVYIDSTANTISRISIFWLKRNEIPDHTTGDIEGKSMANLDLYVYDPSGNLIASSTTSMSNFEIVQFSPAVSGEYQIVITGTSEEKEYIGIALW